MRAIYVPEGYEVVIRPIKGWQEPSYSDLHNHLENLKRPECIAIEEAHIEDREAAYPCAECHRLVCGNIKCRYTHSKEHHNSPKRANRRLGFDVCDLDNMYDGKFYDTITARVPSCMSRNDYGGTSHTYNHHGASNGYNNTHNRGHAHAPAHGRRSDYNIKKHSRYP